MSSNHQMILPRAFQVHWSDDLSNDRIHVIIHLPEGALISDILGLHLIEDGSKLEVEIKARDVFLAPDTLLSHPNVGGSFLHTRR